MAIERNLKIIDNFNLDDGCENPQILECYINSYNRIYLACGLSNAVGEFDDPSYWGYITLDKDDVRSLITELINLEKQI